MRSRPVWVFSLLAIAIGVVACGNSHEGGKPSPSTVSPSANPANGEISIPTTGPPTTLAGTAVATKVPADCTAQALTQAIVQAGSRVAVGGTAVVDSEFVCVQGYAKAIVRAPSLGGSVWAYWHDDSGTWTVLWVGQDILPASSLGIPDDVFNQLKGQVH
jgi:hypothetical protein